MTIAEKMELEKVKKEKVISEYENDDDKIIEINKEEGKNFKFIDVETETFSTDSEEV